MHSLLPAVLFVAVPAPCRIRMIGLVYFPRMNKAIPSEPRKKGNATYGHRPRCCGELDPLRTSSLMIFTAEATCVIGVLRIPQLRRRSKSAAASTQATIAVVINHQVNAPCDH